MSALTAIDARSPLGPATEPDACMLTRCKEWVKSAKKGVRPKKKAVARRMRNGWQSYKDRFHESRLGRLVDPAEAAHRERVKQAKDDATMGFMRMRLPAGSI